MSGEDRRKQIVDKAIDVILEKGLAQAATRDVTRALGVGSGLLHHYFPSWADLRAEAVRLAATREIEAVKALVDGVPALEALERIADWVVEDEDMRHWRLWLNAQDEAHRDALLAEVMTAAMLDWHRLIAGLLAKGAEESGATTSDADDAALRLAALMDGLAGTMLVKGSAMTAGTARMLLKQQLSLECGQQA
ncbi:MAG: TetR family transcriptional regulator C-terminal domain-containing protein [Pseudomonadota bacterium]